ncbi:hypothetical protein EGW08_000167 [Elysia chlorotica]|uniref:ISXO2-like transposase domain-containing protein n=1 Tax=Elysia chlorotica TaxID=188477 RepID=A0A433UEH8_ELYCH|nr:hypothetical protein EGW08_000167 [Elysia chlorotica]
MHRATASAVNMDAFAFTPQHLSAEDEWQAAPTQASSLDPSRYKDAIHETSGALFQEKTTSSETVADCYSYCMEVCTEALLSSRAEGTVTQIGGPNLTVEIDEAKFGKRKFHRGRVMEGQWVLGGICRETWVCSRPCARSRCRRPLIHTTRKGSARDTVLTDEWQAYSRLPEFGFTHQTVNHSKNCVNPETGTNTNLIENIKRSFPSTHTRKELLT